MTLPLGLLVMGLAAASSAWGQGPVDPERLAAAIKAVEEVDGLRRALAQTIPKGGAPLSEATFSAVCKPVGARAKQLSEENGWTSLQMAEKYRNPKHKADGPARKAMALFRRNPELQGVWTDSCRYFRRIVVQETCLGCHGAAHARPDFIKKKYPDDRAHGFRAGDLRGVYSVSLPCAPNSPAH